MNKSQAIATAAKWWTDTLRNPPDADSGDEDIDASLDWAKGKIKQPTEDQLLVFQVALEMELVKMLEGCVWNEDNPHQASYFRTVGTGWGPGWLSACRRAPGRHQHALVSGQDDDVDQSRCSRGAAGVWWGDKEARLILSTPHITIAPQTIAF